MTRRLCATATTAFWGATPAGQALVLRGQVGAPLPTGTPGALAEPGPPPGGAVGDPPAQALAGALLVARTHARPGGAGLGRGETGHVGADLRHTGRRGGFAAARNGPQQRHRLRLIGGRGLLLGHGRRQLSNGVFKTLDVGE